MYNAVHSFFVVTSIDYTSKCFVYLVQLYHMFKKIS